MKVLKFIIIILLLSLPANLLWASEPGLTWANLSTTDIGSLEYPQFAQIAGINNNIYVNMFGYDLTLSTNVAHTTCYDLGTDTWTIKAPMNNPRYNFATAVVNGKIYTIGGADISNISNIVEEYDPSADTWTIKSPLPVIKYDPAVAVFNNKIYTFGGANIPPSSYNSHNVKSVEEYDPATDTWTTKSSLSNIDREKISCLVYNSKIYVFSTRYNNYYSETLTTLEIYDPLTDTWENKETITFEYWFFPLNAILLNNNIYLCNGEETYLYDPDANNCQYLSYSNATHYFSNIIVLNNVLYTLGDYYHNLSKSVFNHTPVLAYTGEAGYENDAIEPEEIKLNTTYTFKIRYFDEDNDPPPYNPKISLYLTHNEYSSGDTSVYANMLQSDPQDNNYTDGKDYYYTYNSTIYDGWPKSYVFSTEDTNSLFTSLHNTITQTLVDDIYPSFSPIEVSPKKGFASKTEFTFRVKYTDPNNLPPADKLKIKIRRSQEFWIYVLLKEEDDKDIDYTDGKFYSGISKIDIVGDITPEIEGENELGFSATNTGASDTFNVTNEALGDLRVSDLFFSGQRLTAGLSFRNNFGICNDGIADSDVEVEYYLSPTKSLTDAYQLKIVDFPESSTVPADGAYYSRFYTVSVPASIPPGSYYLGMLCKSSNDIYGDDQYWNNDLIPLFAGVLSNSPREAYCFPSPAYLSKGDKIHFALLPVNAEIKIMLPSGYVIKELTADENGYVPPWDGATDRDGQIGSGIYLVNINNTKLLKILIIR